MAEAMHVAAFGYDPQGQAGCIALSVGERVAVTDSSREDWWIGHRAGDASATGSFPKAYVKEAAAAPAAAAAPDLRAEREAEREKTAENLKAAVEASLLFEALEAVDPGPSSLDEMAAA